MLKSFPSRPFAIVCVVGPLICAAFAILVAIVPETSGRELITTPFLFSLGILAAILAVRRVGSSSGRRRRAWMSLAAAFCLGVVSNAISLSMNFAGAPEAWLDVVNPILVAALLCGLLGLTLFPAVPRRGTDLVRLIMDGMVVGGSVLFLASATIFKTLLAGRDASLLGQTQILVLPVLDLVTATLAILLIARSGAASRAPLLLVGLASLLNSVSDMAYAVNVSAGAIGLGSWWDLGWFGGYLFFSLAALHPDAGNQSGEETFEASALRSTIVCFAIFLAATVTSIAVSARGQMDIAMSIVWGLLILTVVVRQLVLVMDNEQLRRSLEVRVLERTRALREITTQRELLLASVADGIYGVDSNGVITMVNQATVKLLGRPAIELIGHNAHNLFHAPQSDGAKYPYDGCYISEATTSGLTASGEDDIYIRGDGSAIVVEATASPLRGDNAVAGAVVVFRDVSQRREMDRMKQEFISVVSHELRTPLTSIRGALGLLAGGAFGEIPPKAAQMIDIATSGSVRLGRLVNDILEIERLDTGILPMAIRTHDVAGACKEAIVATSGMAQAAGIELGLGDASGLVRADKDRLVQVLINLIGNAVRFSDAGDSVLVKATPDTERVNFAVCDSGRGIPEDKLDAIFGRFSQVDASDTREKGGTGLGLAICRGLIEGMGGRIWAESTLGEGSTIRFELPAEGSEDIEPPEPVHVSTGQAAL